MNERELDGGPHSGFIAEVEMSSKHDQESFDNMLQRLKSEKPRQSEMKGSIIYGRN